MSGWVTRTETGEWGRSTSSTAIRPGGIPFDNSHTGEVFVLGGAKRVPGRTFEVGRRLLFGHNLNLR